MLLEKIIMRKFRKILGLVMCSIISFSALGIVTIQANAETINEPSPRVAIWEEGRTARVANYNRFVQFESLADCYSNGTAILTYDRMYHFDLLVMDGWRVRSFGPGMCWGSAFNAYDMSQGFDLIGAILGNCYGDSCTCPYSPNASAPRDCSC